MLFDGTRDRPREAKRNSQNEMCSSVVPDAAQLKKISRVFGLTKGRR